ncbi:MAG TPA: tryptophan--tRNA ligase [Porphyromonadaceae bacterium]|jgi:tryptophanyl-tRNA synthetase|uniref:tryptophan--tRNA ligase n=1 Tax=Petrimonas TaxID=307628 RepID=UPI000E9474B2|nr:tryptophan--tRNA ligase [Petrimonas sp.]NLU30856.1 tryptophan--tRNA ligase [Bacteroidales bacterium]BBD44312.1 tryptophan--tRNA ligase [Petrimonas sp. IBARAKI]HBC38901.1 tryptophan--tRNA ligase [Porphyromonadaceae bacterium]MDD4015796.1 tryptophan--tRNA ligase [Petrimonas sp.]
MDTVLSGIRSTGNLHLGNYFGALRNFIRMQDENRCFFFIADIHSLTTHPDPKDLHGNVKNVLVDYLAAGIDPGKSVIYIQSDVPETIELYLYLNMHAYMGELAKTTSFKEKARKQPENVNAGLLTYPTLMAADILIHNADKVPVGKDQEQHLEMTRKFARRFNNFYGVEFFKEPVAYNFGEELVKIPGLDGSGKMGKSEGNAIYLADSPKEIEKKVKRALTDSGPTQPNSVKPDYIENLFTIMRVVSTPEVVEHYENKWNACDIRYGDLKKQLAEDIIKVTSPIRERILEIEKDDAYLRKVTREGAEKARESASKTIAAVREIVGFKKF